MQLLCVGLWALGHISSLLAVALLFTCAIVHSSLHGLLAIDPFVHLAIAKPGKHAGCRDWQSSSWTSRILRVPPMWWQTVSHVQPWRVCMWLRTPQSTLFYLSGCQLWLLTWIWTVVYCLVLLLYMHLGSPRPLVAHSSLCCTYARVHL